MEKLIYVLPAITMTLSAVHAQEFKDPMVPAALDAFYGMCLNPAYKAIDHIEFAELMEWQDLPDVILDRLTPPSNPDLWRGWVATSPDGNSIPFFALAGAASDGTQICGAFFRDTDPKEFIEAFKFETDATELDRDLKFGVTAIYLTLPDFPMADVSIAFPRTSDDVQVFAVFAN